MMSNTYSNRILYLSETTEGKEHDKTILIESDLNFKEEIEAFVDLAYKGLAMKNVIIIIPDKKPKNKELTAEQKASNKEKSKIRVRIEHAISGVKRLHILKHKLRIKKYEQHDLVMLLGCSLHNFRRISREINHAEIQLI